MKRLNLFLSILLLLPAAAFTQSLPDSPAPAPPPDPAWERVEHLTQGAPIVVRNDNGPPVHCLFSGATDAYLFCDPPGNPPGVGWRFDRASIISVDLDRPSQSGAQLSAPQHDYHPAWIASILAGGLIVGLAATRTMDDGDAAKAGAIGALVVGAIGAPLAFLPRPNAVSAGPVYPVFGLRVPIARSATPRFHLHFVMRKLR
jgi:hypothetical protein